MSSSEIKYCEYFNVNEAYFPCIDESAINAGVDWAATYPHETFIALLNQMEKMLSGSTNRSLWIHGAYGTGKSQCAYALKRLLEVFAEEFSAYWDKYDALKKQNSLKNKLLGHKEHGIVTAYRYASGSITTPQQLFFAVQESIKTALDGIPGSYKGENTLKESVIDWLEDPAHNGFMNALLQKPKWMALFSQSTADEIINTLKKRSEVSEIMGNIFKMAAEEGITALSMTADSLRKWIVDVVTHNNTKIVLIWDEFSGFFRQNRNSLDEFQKIVSICEEAHFYFVIVTHPLTSITGVGALSKDDPMSVVQQRFDKVEITLPSNIAFELTGHAFSVIPAAKPKWDVMTGDLSAKVSGAKSAVMKATDVKDEKVMQHMLPIQPMAALVLKNIASAFQSNQRSMFDFIKTPKDLDVQAFQWFIQNTSPISDRPLLTIDMLWDFFYEKGKDYLSSDIKLVLDTFPQQTNLTEKEKVVLKTILIMQSVDQRLGGSVPLLKPTDQNLGYAFEGDWPEYENGCKNIAKALVTKGILIQTPIADGKKVYAAAVLAGDGAKIDGYKAEVRKNGTIDKLVEEGGQLSTALGLNHPLRLRFAQSMDTGALPIVTPTNFTKTMNALKSKDLGWRFYAVLALAKTDEEAQSFRNLIKKTISDEEYRNITVIDALSTPLGLEEFEKYVDYSAMSLYYNGNNKQQSADNARKAKEVLDRAWKDCIHDGQFILWTYANQDGEKATGAQSVHTALQAIVHSRFAYAPDFTKGLTETQLKLTQPKPVAKYGMDVIEIKGLIAGCEEKVLGKVWKRDHYWTDSETAGEMISKIKVAVNNMVEESFRIGGRISIDEIYDFLEGKYGFTPSNLSAFMVGFLLKEYSRAPYRYQDSEGAHESMTPDKLSEMIGNYINGKSKPTYIVSLTPEEKAFYELTEAAWGVSQNACSSPSQAGSLIQGKMREIVYPVWTLEEVDNTGAYDIVKKYIALVQSEAKVAHGIAIEIGGIALNQQTLGENLKALITAENCQKGMMLFLEHFDERKLLNLANEIGASGNVLGDIKKLFSVKHSAQWVSTTGEDEILKLTTEYEIIKHTNILLNVSANTRDGAFKAWRETMKFAGFSCEAVQSTYPALKEFFAYVLKIVNYEDILPDMMKQFLTEITLHNAEIRDVLTDTVGVFASIYEPYLNGFTLAEKEEIKNSIKDDMFVITATKSNAILKKAADDYRKNQIKSQLFGLWSAQTHGTKNPRQWSEKYKTPILCCIEDDIYTDAKKVFSTLNSATQSEAEIQYALSFLENATFFEKLEDVDYRNRCFMRRLVGYYEKLLPDVTAIRSALDALPVDVYDWIDDPSVKSKIRSLATAEYNAGGSDSAISTIDSMGETELRDWLKMLVTKDMELGVKIISNGRK